MRRWMQDMMMRKMEAFRFCASKMVMLSSGSSVSGRAAAEELEFSPFLEIEFRAASKLL